MIRTFSVEPNGKKFATVCRTDGYWSITWLSKTKRAAAQKGDDFVSGKRTAMRKYLTKRGEELNAAKSVKPRRVMIVNESRPSIALAAALAFPDLISTDHE